MEPWLDSIQYQPALTAQDQHLRDDFVDQYLLDYNAVNACLRLNYNPQYAAHMAKQFMVDSYVLRRIEDKKRQVPEEEPQNKWKAWISAELMSRATYSGPGSSESAKIAALDRLMELHGLKQSSKAIPSVPTALTDESYIEGEFEQELTLEQLQAECERKGLQTSMLKYDRIAEE